MSKQFQISKVVTSDVLDEMEHVNNVEYLRWVQEISKQHWEAHATKQMLSDYAWVALEHHIEYKKQAFLGDKLILKTFISEWKAATCVRVVEIYRDDKLITKSASNWCLLKTETRKPTRITAELSEPFS